MSDEDKQRVKNFIIGKETKFSEERLIEFYEEELGESKENIGKEWKRFF
jgi:hypothetical protein